MPHRSAPNSSVAAGEHYINNFGLPVLIMGNHNPEHGRGLPACFICVDDLVGRSSFRIKKNKTCVGTYPKLTARCFYKIVNIPMRQTLIGGVVSEAVAVEA